jgi:hypothetical protein
VKGTFAFAAVALVMLQLSSTVLSQASKSHYRVYEIVKSQTELPKCSALIMISFQAKVDIALWPER